MPKSMEWDGPAGLGKIAQKTVLRENDTGHKVVEVLRTVDLKDAVIPADDYPTLLNADRRVKHPSGHTLLISFN